MDKATYLEFFITMCTQAAYHLSSSQLFHPCSLLKNMVPMSEAKYNEIWKLMSEKKRISESEMVTNRRERPIWETLENIVNGLFRSISVTGRVGRIAIALDDDKVWMNLKNSSSDDLFNLKYCTHVQANRKGLVLHTATSTALMIPLGAVFEKKKDSTMSCFKRLLNFLYQSDGSTNLRNASVHSDRGYMIPSLVFDYLLSSGAEVVGTVKRMAQCWPFTFNQTLKDSDKRTSIDTKGAPTLFLKWCKTGTKYVFASAFRNGTDRVATAISTMHTQHQWEGVVLNNCELQKYKENKLSLSPHFFNRVENLNHCEERSSESEKEVLEQLLENKIDAYTLRQGKCIYY